MWLGHMDIPGLAMSRSLGDTVAHTAGVISEPEMSIVELRPEDKVLIWASDGLWEFMSNQVSCGTRGGRKPGVGTRAHVQLGAGEGEGLEAGLGYLLSLLRALQEVIDMIAGIDDPKTAVDKLVAEANTRWMKEEQVVDDTTVIVIFLDVCVAQRMGWGGQSRKS